MNRIELRDGKLGFSHGGCDTLLVLSCWETDRWQAALLHSRDGAFVAELDNVRCRLRLTEEKGEFRYQLSLDAKTPARIPLQLEVRRLAHLITSESDTIDRARYWEFRADPLPAGIWNSCYGWAAAAVLEG
jgi:hypothetical protein